MGFKLLGGGELSYKDAAGGNQTVANPSLPWTRTETINPGDEASISASGQVTDGSLAVSFSAANASSNIDREDGCARSQTG